MQSLRDADSDVYNRLIDLVVPQRETYHEICVLRHLRTELIDRESTVGKSI